MSRVRVSVFAVTVLTALASAADPPPAPVKPAVVRVVAFSPDGATLVAAYTAKDAPGGAVAWEVATGQRIWHSPGTASAVSFAPDGSAVALARGKRTAVRLDPRT